MENSKIYEKVPSELKSHIDSLIFEFGIVKQENKRISLEKTILETQVNFEKAKISDLENHFKKVQEALSLKDQNISNMYAKLLADHYELHLNNSRLLQENQQLKSNFEAIVSNQIKLINHESYATQASQQEPTEIYQNEIVKVQELFTEHFQIYQNLNSNLVKIVRNQSLNFAQKVETLVKYVQSLIEILRESEQQIIDRKIEKNGRELSRKVFFNDSLTLSSSFLKLFNEKTTLENKFLVFCIEQIKNKLEEMKVDFPFHLLESEFLVKNRDSLIPQNLSLYATIESLSDQNAELEKKVFMNQEISQIRKRIKTSKVSSIEEVSNGLVVLTEETKIMRHQDEEALFMNSTDQIQSLEKLNNSNLEKLSASNLKIASLETTIKIQDENNKILNTQIVNARERFTVLSENYKTLQNGITKISSNLSELNKFANVKHNSEFFENYAIESVGIFNKINELALENDSRAEFSKKVDLIVNELVRSNQKLLEKLAFNEETAKNQKLESEMLIEKMILPKEITHCYFLNQQKSHAVIETVTDTKCFPKIQNILAKFEHFEEEKSLKFKRTEQRLITLKRKIERLKIELANAKNSVELKINGEVQEKNNTIKRLENEIQIIHIGREKFMEYLQSKFKNLVC